MNSARFRSAAAMKSSTRRFNDIVVKYIWLSSHELNKSMKDEVNSFVNTLGRSAAEPASVI